MIAEKYLNIFILGFVEVVEGGAELVELLLSDALAVPRQDLVLHLVDCPGEKQMLNLDKIFLSKVFEIISCSTTIYILATPSPSLMSN